MRIYDDNSKVQENGAASFDYKGHTVHFIPLTSNIFGNQRCYFTKKGVAGIVEVPTVEEAIEAINKIVAGVV